MPYCDFTGCLLYLLFAHPQKDPRFIRFSIPPYMIIFLPGIITKGGSYETPSLPAEGAAGGFIFRYQCDFFIARYLLITSAEISPGAVSRADMPILLSSFTRSSFSNIKRATMVWI